MAGACQHMRLVRRPFPSYLSRYTWETWTRIGSSRTRPGTNRQASASFGALNRSASGDRAGEIAWSQLDLKGALSYQCPRRDGCQGGQQQQ